MKVSALYKDMDTRMEGSFTTSKCRENTGVEVLIKCRYLSRSLYRSVSSLLQFYCYVEGRGGGIPNTLFCFCFRFPVILFTYCRRTFIADGAS
jgi:hypothetical protein